MLKAKITLPDGAADKPTNAGAATDTRTEYQKRFAEGRRAAGLTLAQLGEKVTQPSGKAMSAQAISQFERGVDSISLVNFLTAVDAMGLRVEWVLTGAGRMWKAAPATGRPKQKRAAGRAAPEGQQ